MDALTEASVRLLKRVNDLESRLARMEELKGVKAAEPPPIFTAVPPASPPIPPPLPVFAEARVEVPHPAPPLTAEAPARLETRMGLTWINRIGVITLIIGVAFFFKYAVDNQWIGETGRVVLGVLAGFVTLVVADLLWRRGQKVFAQGVCGLGVSILYLSFYASFSFYHLLPQAAAFILMVSVTAMAGALALRYDAMAIAALGMLGGYATPLLLSTGQDAPWTFFSYLFLIDLGAVAMARARRWLPLGLIAFVATAILYLSWFGEWFRPEKQVVATVAAFAFYALFAFVDWSWIFYAVQALTALGLAAIWPHTVPFLILSLIVGAAGLVVADLLKRPPAATLSFSAFWIAFGIWFSSHSRVANPLTIFRLLSIAFAMYLIWIPFEKLVRRVELRAQHLIVLALNGVIYFACGYALLEPHYHAWMGLFAAAVAGGHLSIGIRLWKEQSSAGRDTRPVMLALGIALGFLTLAVPIQFNGFSITLSWALEAAALVWIGTRTGEDRIWFGALAVYAFVFVRLYTFDSFMLEAHRTLLWNGRFLTFVVSAVSFWLGAYWLKSMRPPAALAYSAGHLVMLSACLFEYNDWALTTNPDNQSSVVAIGVSILMALYAVGLISIGVGFRSVLDRILGLGLIGLVVLKLYLYDVWEASRLFRTVAFVALGVLLLLTSYLYSRFRPTIENWWKDEKATASQ